jgi:DNA polymerase III alpha subunit (gram-positive type)
MPQPKLLFLDSEWTHALALVYNNKPNWINSEDIIQQPTCISIQWAFNDEKPKAMAAKHLDDKEVVLKLIQLLNEADIVIGHNVDRFDIPKLRWRARVHGLDSFPKVGTVDTLKLSRKLYGQGPLGHSLGNLCSRLELQLKDYLSKDDLKEFLLHGDKKALRRILSYGKQDIVTLRELYHKMLPDIPNHPHMKAYAAHELVCRNCGSTNIYKSKSRPTAAGIMKHQYHCKDCGSYTTGGKI